MKQKTGIYLRASDNTQPYRVYFKGKIYWFAKTLTEAKMKLAQAQHGK